MSAPAKTTRPACVKNAHLMYLDELRQSGITNMYGARPYLMSVFPRLTAHKAGDVLGYWMRSFSERHPTRGGE